MEMKITEEVIRIGLTALADNNLRDLHNSSENTKAKFIIVLLFIQNNSYFTNKLKHAYLHWC